MPTQSKNINNNTIIMLHPAIFDVTFLRFNTCFTFPFLFKKDGTIMPASLMEQF